MLTARRCTAYNCRDFFLGGGLAQGPPDHAGPLCVLARSAGAVVTPLNCTELSLLSYNVYLTYYKTGYFRSLTLLRERKA